MNLTLVTETYAPEINGVALTLGHLVRHLSTHRGYHVTVIRPRQVSERNQDRVLTHEGVRQQLTPGLPIPGYPLLRFGLPARRTLERLWRDTRPDVIHVATEGPLGASALNAARALRLPVTSSFHTNFHQYARNYRFGWLSSATGNWLRSFHNRTLRTFAPTRHLCESLALDGYRNLRVLSRGVDLTLFSPHKRLDSLRAAWGAGPEDPVVLHAGRLAREKNYELLFRAYSAIRKANPHCRFVLVGDGPLRATLQQRLPDGIFTGFVDRETLAAHYASADIYLHASVTETYGNVAAEALASGLAFVGFNYAAAHELVRPGTTGILIPEGDELEFMGAAVQLAVNPHLVGRLRANARATIRGRTWESVAAGFDGDLAEAVADYATGQPPRQRTPSGDQSLMSKP